MARRGTIRMCDGPLLKNILLYSIPLMASGALQLLYNMADSIVVAKWAGGTALAAVGSTGPLINVIVNLFTGLSVGASVTTAHYYGANDRDNVHKTVHSAIALSIIGGFITAVLGIIISPQALLLMGTPADVLDQATLYLRIYFLGVPASMVYNYASAILRSVGDTRRPLYILIISGLVNVVLNIVLVVRFHWDVAGVATATTISQILSAVLALYCLMNSNDIYKFEFDKMRIYRDKLLLMLKHGIPAGVQSSIFSMSNVIIQSSVNSFGVAAMSGNTAAANTESLVYIAMNSFHHTCLAFTGQNMGAKKPERVRKTYALCMLSVTAIGLLLGWVVYLFGEPLLTLYTAASSTQSTIASADIISYGMRRLSIITTTYFLCGIMEVSVGALRGLGATLAPMVVSIVGVCVVRIVWIFTVFKFISPTIECLYLSYCVSWAITGAIQAVCYLVLQRKRLSQICSVQTE